MNSRYPRVLYTWSGSNSSEGVVVAPSTPSDVVTSWAPLPVTATVPLGTSSSLSCRRGNSSGSTSRRSPTPLAATEGEDVTPTVKITSRRPASPVAPQHMYIDVDEL